MIKLSEISYYAYLFPAVVLLIAIVWNVVKHLSFLGGFSKIVITFCVSLLCLLIISDMFVTISPSKIQEIQTNPSSQVLQPDSPKCSEDQVGRFLGIFWLLFIFVISVLIILLGSEEGVREKMNAFFGITRKIAPDESEKQQV